MSYGSIDGGSFGGRNPFGGSSRQGYQPLGAVGSSESYSSNYIHRGKGDCLV